jgi:hypothetical protein
MEQGGAQTMVGQAFSATVSPDGGTIQLGAWPAG